MTHEPSRGIIPQDIGIDIHTKSESQLFRWLLACLLFSKPIQQHIAAVAYQTLIAQDITSIKQLSKARWDNLVGLLDQAHYTRYDFSTATKLIHVARTMHERYGSVSEFVRASGNAKTLEENLSIIGGIGPVTAELFTDQVAPVWYATSLSHSYEVALIAASVLEAKGFDVFVVGGAVRDLWLGHEPKDFDLVTNATPEQIIALKEFDRSFYKDTAQAYGVTRVRVAHNGRTDELEIATFRKDVEAHRGRKETKVEFAGIEDDVLRRDFTINALALDMGSSFVIDFVGGIEDLERGIIRFIGDPLERIKEDPLRLMRAIRFKNFLGFSYHPDTALAIHEAVRQGYVEKIAVDRLRGELTRLFVHPTRQPALIELDEFGILERVLPEVAAGKGVEQPERYHEEGDVWQHQLLIFDSLPSHPSARLAWAALLHDIGKGPTRMVPQGEDDHARFNRHYAVGAEMATTIMRRLNFSRKDTNDVHWMIYNHMGIDDIPSMKPSHRHKLLGHPAFEDLLELHRADAAASWRPEQPRNVKPEFKEIERMWHEYLSAPPKTRQPSLKRDLGIDGTWILRHFKDELGDNPGPKIGEILEQFEAWYHDTGTNNENDYLLKATRLLKK